MNETIKTILSRRSVRSYTDRPVPKEILECILSCGIHAPSGRNYQEIVLTAVTNPERIEQIRMLAWQEFLKMEEEKDQPMNLAIHNAKTKSDYNFTFRAPVVVIASGPSDWPNCMADSALALGNVMLAAASLGLGSCYVNQLHWLNKNAAMRSHLATLGITPEDSIYGTVVLGYSDGPQRPPLSRKEGRIRIIT